MGTPHWRGPRSGQFAEMTLTRNKLFPLAAVVAAFAAALVLFHVLNGGSAPQGATSDSGAPAHARTTDQQIAALQAVVRAHPRDAGSYVLLGDAYLQKVRETGDAGFYTRSQGVLERARKLNPRYSAVYTGLGTLALARHDFKSGLAYGLEAHRLAPAVVRPLGVIVDAQVELGRYEDASRTLQRMVDLKPNLASYARVSYFRELHGDLTGATRAMELAVDAGGGAPENVAYVQSLLGDLEFVRGHLAAAATAYRRADFSFPRYPQAEAGLAKVDAARGRFAPAIERLRGVVDRLPLPAYVVQLGETELAAGRTAGAKRDLELVRAEQRLLAANGVNTDTELALYEADHGSPARAVTLAQRAWQNAPSVRSADAVEWALTADGRAREALPWARRALHLGSRDPLFLYHAGMTARAAGATGLARTWLTRSLSLNPRFSPLYAPRAERALGALR
jgi:tetratricopeptide (TPR) repeat protein